MLSASKDAHLNEVVEDAERHDDAEEDGRGVADDDDGGDDREEGVDPAADERRQQVVDRLYKPRSSSPTSIPCIPAA